MRSSCLLALFVLALVGQAHAAPAPFFKPAPPEVELVGWHRDPTLADGAPRVILCQEDYRNVVLAWNIENPPKVDFRTHFLVVTASTGSLRGVRCRVEDGDLRTVELPPSPNECSSGPPSFNARLTSVPRAGVRTVDGQPLPRR